MCGSGMKTGLDRQINESQPKWWKSVCLEKEHGYGLTFQWAHRISVMGGTGSSAQGRSISCCCFAPGSREAWVAMAEDDFESPVLLSPRVGITGVCLQG